MKRIELRGKYAVGEHRWALVDDGDFAWLNQWAWKAKWNAGRNNIYAVRTSPVDGKTVDIRMHREVMGLKRGAPQEVDHRDHFGLNNQRANFRIATRSENLLNARRKLVDVNCAYCGASALRDVSAMRASSGIAYCSARCAEQAQRAPHSAVSFPFCALCSKRFTARFADAFWCSEACRARQRRSRRLSLRQRVLLAMSEPGVPADIARRAGTHESEIRRVLPELKAEGLVIAVAYQRHRHGRPAVVYVAAASAHFIGVLPHE